VKTLSREYNRNLEEQKYREKHKMAGKNRMKSDMVATSKTVKGKVCMGAMILYMARMYNTVQKVLCELIQNQIDSKANKIQHVIDLQKGTWNAYDNGSGASSEEMELKFQNIGRSTKGPEDIGEKGIGYFAGLAIASIMVFISRLKIMGKAKQPFFRIPLDREEVEGMNDVRFRIETLDLRFAINDGWSTAVSLKKLEKTAIAAIERLGLDGLCDYVATTYRDKIRQQKVSIEIILVDQKGGLKSRFVTPLEYDGKRQVVEIPTTMGTVLFEMFLTRQKQKKPSIMVSHERKISFPLRNLEVWDVVADVLGSGHLQGNINVDFCSITEGREGFVINDALSLLNQAVIKFVTDHAAPWLADLQQTRKDDRIEDAALKVLEKVEQRLRAANWQLGPEFLASVSPGHYGGTKAPEDGMFKTKRQKKRDADLPDLPGAKTPGKGKEKGITHPGVASPNGTKRRIVKGQRGLQIVMVESEGFMIRVGNNDDGENNGKILISTTNRTTSRVVDRATNPEGRQDLERYLENLVTMIIARQAMTDERGRIFQEEYEGTLLSILAGIN
jgi:hypothetical protein